MYNNGKELLEFIKENNFTKISQAVIEKEKNISDISEEQIRKRTRQNLLVMKDSAQKALDQKIETVGGMISGDSKKLEAYRQNGETICGNIIVKAMARALSCSEVNASMGRICAAPTAGSCGIIPSTIITVSEFLNSKEDDIIDALITAAGIGAIITANATVSGAEGGCQAECGSAAAMAAAGIVQLKGGSPESCLHAASIAIKNILGLVCDPIAGIVEAPCAKRNASGAVNAMVSADLALSGIISIIPFDEVIEAMYKVGRLLPTSLRETALGGVAATKTAKEISKRIFGN